MITIHGSTGEGGSQVMEIINIRAVSEIGGTLR